MVNILAGVFLTSPPFCCDSNTASSSLLVAWYLNCSSVCSY